MQRGISPYRLIDAAGNLVLVGYSDKNQFVSAYGELRRFANKSDYNPDIFCVWKRQHEISCRFWNRDGSSEPMCGNALRALGYLLLASDGKSCAIETPFTPVRVYKENDNYGIAIDASRAQLSVLENGNVFVDIGTPHLIKRTDELLSPREESLARFLQETLNVSVTLLAHCGGQLNARTFERGGPGETGSCGTGAVSSFLAARALGIIRSRGVDVLFGSGKSLRVDLDTRGMEIRLMGKCLSVAF
jgi:diaminopimelate epimerase